MPNGVPATVVRDARLWRESFTRSRRDVSSPIVDARIAGHIRKIEAGRAQPFRQILEVLWDLKHRGAPQVAIEAVARTLLAVIQSWYAQPDRPDVAQLDLIRLVRDETQAEAIANPFELELLVDASPKSIADASEKLDQHLIELEQLSSALHRRRVA